MSSAELDPAHLPVLRLLAEMRCMSARHLHAMYFRGSWENRSPTAEDDVQRKGVSYAATCQHLTRLRQMGYVAAFNTGVRRRRMWHLTKKGLGAPWPADEVRMGRSPGCVGDRFTVAITRPPGNEELIRFCWQRAAAISELNLHGAQVDNDCRGVEQFESEFLRQVGKDAPEIGERLPRRSWAESCRRCGIQHRSGVKIRVCSSCGERLQRLYTRERWCCDQCASEVSDVALLGAHPVTRWDWPTRSNIEAGESCPGTYRWKPMVSWGWVVTRDWGVDHQTGRELGIEFVGLLVLGSTHVSAERALEMIKGDPLFLQLGVHLLRERPLRAKFKILYMPCSGSVWDVDGKKWAHKGGVHKRFLALAASKKPWPKWPDRFVVDDCPRELLAKEAHWDFTKAGNGPS